METITGYVDDKEKLVLEDILEKKKALENLFKIVDEEKEPGFYEDVKQDYAQTRDSYEGWWAAVEKKYGLGGIPLRIDMETGALLVNQEE